MIPDADGFVDVFTTAQESEALVVASLLESAGIDAKIVPPIMSRISGDGIHQDFLGDGYVIRVNPDQAEDARAFIDRSQDSSDEQGSSEQEE